MPAWNLSNFMNSIWTGVGAIVLLLELNFILAIELDSFHSSAFGERSQSDNLLQVIFGESRRLFGVHFIKKADAYFHRGAYPGVFDESLNEELHIAETEEKNKESEHHAELHSFLKPPIDFLERFGRNFMPTIHVHLASNNQMAEIMPWIRLSSALDPQNVDAYVIGAYWLRTALKMTNEAEMFLREGLKANPQHPALLYELGRLKESGTTNLLQARTLYQLALKNYTAKFKPYDDKLLYMQILSRLALIEEKLGNKEFAINYWEKLMPLSPDPTNILKRIDQLKGS